jgi:hypothetical protein
LDHTPTMPTGLSPAGAYLPVRIPWAMGLYAMSVSPRSRFNSLFFAVTFFVSFLYCWVSLYFAR